MFSSRATIGLGVLALYCFGFASSMGGEQPPQDASTPEDQQAVTSKATPRPAASAVNFRKELNLPFDSLSTLGSRIESARRKPDPVALAHAANELAVSEKVSGKTASITS